MTDLVDRWLDKHGFHHFEGDSGVERLNKFCEAIGYKESGFRFGSPLESFLSDNPGAIEVILDWVREHSFFDDALAENLGED
jgi:hypothetical protein